MQQKQVFKERYSNIVIEKCSPDEIRLLSLISLSEKKRLLLLAADEKIKFLKANAKNQPDKAT